MRKRTVIMILVGSMLFIQACSLTSKRTAPDSTSMPVFMAATILPTITPTPLPSATIPVPTNMPACENNLAYVEDITLPDGSQVAANAALTKEWLVANRGSCNWTTGYKLKFVIGDDFVTPKEIPLPEAWGGSQTPLKLDFTAPATPGMYHSEWQAFGPDGQPFGDTIYFEIVVE